MQEQSNTGIPWRRIFAPISIIATVLYVLIFLGELIHGFHEKFMKQPPPKIMVTMRENVGRQIQQVGSVNTYLLAKTLNDDLSTFDCKWYFVCSPHPKTTTYNVRFNPDCPTCHLQLTSNAPAVVPPQLTYSIGGLPIPTLHTVFGTPHALRIAAAKIVAAGPWAILMFLSCTVIYFSIALIWAGVLSAKQESTSPLIVITLSPLGITLLANLFQWAAARVFHGVYWAFGPLITVAVYSSAISLAVAVPHIWKAPHEIAEAAELLRKA